MKIIVWSLGSRMNTGYYFDVIHMALESLLKRRIAKYDMTGQESREYFRKQKTEDLIPKNQIYMQCWGVLKNKYLSGIYEKPDLAVLILPCYFSKVLDTYQQEPVIRQCPVIYVFGDYPEYYFSQKNKIGKQYRMPQEILGCIPANLKMEEAYVRGELAIRMEEIKTSNSFHQQCYLKEVEKTAFVIAKVTEEIMEEKDYARSI